MMTEKRDKTPAEIEAEARERARAERNISAPVAEIKPGQPEVNRLKKRGTGRVMTLGILLLAGLIVLAWMGDWAYSHLMRSPEKKTNDASTPSQTHSSTERHDLGQGTDPLNEARTGMDTPASSAAQTAPLPTPVTFNKSMALATSSEETSPQQGAVVTRSAERTVTSAASVGQPPAEPAAYTPCPVVMVRDAHGSLICPADPHTSEDTEEGTTATVSTVTAVSRITLDPDLYIAADTYIPCSLQTRFVSTVAGRISCLISEDVYSESTHVRLIPAGTRARGIYKTGSLNQGQGRMFVIWTELRTPDGLRIPMIESQVVGQLGEAGIDGWIDTHFWARFGNAMMLSTVQDVAAAAAGAAPSKSRNTDYTENSRSAAAEMAKTTLDNSINIPPTIYKNQGDIIGIMTGADIDFSSVYRLSLKPGRTK
jgi:type IV secretion system protein VirB10